MNARTMAALVVLGAAVAVGQEAEDYRFGDVIDVDLVNVEVWVTDREGVPVTGLTAADFEILEDGEPVTITHFGEVIGDQPTVPVYAREATGAVEGATAGPEPQPPVVEPGHLVIYFDQLHLVPSSRKRALADLRDFLAAGQVAPERVLVLSQDSELETVATFGSSWEEIDATLVRMEETTPRGAMMESEKRLVIRRLHDLWREARELSGSGPAGGGQDAACSYFLPRAVPDVEIYAAQRRQMISTTLDHLASTAAFLTGVPGMKTLLFLSDALERAPGTDLIAFVRSLCPTESETPLFVLSDELSREFRRLTRHANANRVTIYALQTGGLKASFMGGADQAAVDFRAAASFDPAVRQTERDGLSNLAAETGGRAIFNRNELGAELRAIAREMSSYYSLAYEPAHGGDEADHQIEVELANRALRARHRGGYRDKNPDVRMTERLQAAVYLGLVSNPLGVRLGAGSVTTTDKSWVTMPLHVLIPRQNLVFLPEAEASIAHLSMQVSTRNTRTQKGIFEQRSFRVQEPPEADQDIVALVVDLVLPPGVHVVAVGLRDDASSEASFVSTTVELNATAPATGSGQ